MPLRIAPPLIRQTGETGVKTAMPPPRTVGREHRRGIQHKTVDNFLVRLAWSEPGRCSAALAEADMLHDRV
jgi:hypothetical protein